MTTEREDAACEAIERIARIAKHLAGHDSTSSMEIAAGIVSYLATHLEEVPKLVKGMSGPSSWPVDWHTQGALNWRRADGKIHHPGEEIRSGIELGVTNESAKIVTWLRAQASEQRRRAGDGRFPLAERLEYEKQAIFAEATANKIELGDHRQPPREPVF